VFSGLAQTVSQMKTMMRQARLNNWF
jgi:hypothetical protein